DDLRVAGGGQLAQGRDLQPRLPGAPGRDPLPRDRLRPRQPDRGHLLRDHQPADQALVSVVELEARELTLEGGGGGLWSDAWSRLRRNRGAIVGSFLVTAFVVIAIFAPLIAPYSPREGNLGLVGPPHYCCPGPTGQHLLGVDQQGRDELSRIFYGARFSL